MISTRVTIFTVFFYAILAHTSIHAASGDTLRISLTASGQENNGDDYDPSISATGRYITFYSGASDLVPDDTNKAYDIFIYDLVSGVTERINLSTLGVEANLSSFIPSISADGRYIAYATWATTLVPDDTNGRDDIMVYDRQTKETTRVSVSFIGAQAIGSSYYPEISLDGRNVVFESRASNLVPGDTTGTGANFNEHRDIFIHNLSKQQTIRTNLSSNGDEANRSSNLPTISANGRYVVFDSMATNLVPDDINAQRDVFYHDRTTRETIAVTTAGDGTSFDPHISEDGRFIVFSSQATNLVPDDDNNNTDIFLFEIENGSITRISTAAGGGDSDDDSVLPVISSNGQYIAFQSWATNIVADDTNNEADIFVHDRSSGVTTRVSVSSLQSEGNAASYEPDISLNGRYVVFYSEADNLVPNDTNGKFDIFIHDFLGPAGSQP